MIKRHVYLKTKALDEALEILLNRFDLKKLLGTEVIPSVDAYGRISCEPVYAKLSSPPCHVAAMDGYAVLASNTFSASYDTPLKLKINENAFPVNTGQPLPDNTDAVIMIENVNSLPDNYIEIVEPVYPWQNVRKVGEDIIKTELLFPVNHKFNAYDIGAILTAGIKEVKVYKKPIISIIPTGSELISVEDISDNEYNFIDSWGNLRVVESNSYVIKAILEQIGCIIKKLDAVSDNYDEIKNVLTKEINSEAHIVILIAGSSAGSEDYTSNIIEELGDVLIHGITMMPGKPSIAGEIAGKPVFGVPGYPVSAVMCVERFIVPFLYRSLMQEPPKKPTIRAKVSTKIPSKSGLTEFRRVVVGKVGEQYVVSPLKKGAGAITTLTRANAILTIPANLEGINQGEEVTVELLSDEADLEKNLICIGSHDLALDIIKDLLRQKRPVFNMYSTHVGSLGGILAVRDYLAHIAGTHLFDPETNTFNITYVKKHLKYQPFVLINLSYRTQGLIVKKGNPKGIKDLTDLVRDDITFINRQKGAGTRVLLDYYLKKLNLDPRDIRGYDNEETTHLGVAINVLSGKVDVGLGIESASKIFDLDFIPVFEERYDLLILKNHLKTPLIDRVLDIINSGEFKEKVESLGGYSLRDCGKVMYEEG